MSDAVWPVLVVMGFSGVWVLVGLLAHVCLTAREMLAFMRHQALLRAHYGDVALQEDAEDALHASAMATMAPSAPRATPAHMPRF